MRLVPRARTSSKKNVGGTWIVKILLSVMVIASISGVLFLRVTQNYRSLNGNRAVHGSVVEDSPYKGMNVKIVPFANFYSFGNNDIVEKHPDRPGVFVPLTMLITPQA